ncbi:MAG: hypothetical protein ACKOWF_02240 [Chloroflexota bacterium]
MKLPPNREGRIGCLLALAMVAAPFVALLYGVESALAVLALATGATAWLAFAASGAAPPERRPSLLMAAGVNALFCLMAAWMFLARVL